ncbi:MAG: oxidative damage protection protein [Candidatus Dasytiphilus stammeri]
MKNIIYCQYLEKKSEGLDNRPYPGPLGNVIYKNFSKEVWLQWLTIQTRIINEKKLNMLKDEDRNFIKKRMMNFLFIEQM